MRSEEAGQLSGLFSEVLEDLPYYNRAAKTGELAKYSPDQLRAATSEDPDSVLVAKIGTELAGFCFTKEDDFTTWLAWLGVGPAHRRKGIGTALLYAVERSALRRGRHKIWCDSRTDNEASKLTLAAHGYAKICIIQKHWYEQDFILWEKLVS
jgi:ribosomal protein S18 acetylase RimI-like enzyme